MTDLTYDALPLQGTRDDSAASETPTGIESPRRATFVALFEEHFERLHRYLNRLCGDVELASELAQDAFVRLYQRSSLPDDPEAWLFTVGTNLARNAGSKRARRARLLSVQRGRDAHSEALPSPEESMEAAEIRLRVRATMDGLRDRDRALLALFADGYSYREIAVIVELHEASVGTLLRRAKDRFRAAYEEATHAP